MTSLSLRPARLLARLVDVSLWAGLVAFALWTGLYEIALAAPRSVSLWTMVPVWLVLCALAGSGAALVAARRRSAEQPPAPPGPEASTRSPHLTRGLRTVVVVAVIGCGVLAVRRDEGELLGLVVLGLVAVLGLLALGWPSRSLEMDTSAAAGWQHGVAVGLGLAAAVLSSLLLNTDADDVYYVNRSVWVAQHGTATLRDTIFGPQTFPGGYGAGIPFPSVEGLLGALAHTVHVSAAGLSYLAAVPVIAFYAVWALWVLVRLWAPRRLVLALTLAVGFSLVSGVSVVGNYSFGRLWQGKVMAFTIVVPLIWAVATRLATHRRSRDLGAMFVLGVCFVGLTSSAVLLVPVIAAALLVAAACLRRRRLAIGAVLLAAAPVVTGLVVAGVSTSVGPGVSAAPTPWSAYELVLGPSAVMSAVAVLAVVLLPLSARRGPVVVVAAASAAVPLVTLLPGVINVANEATGSGPVLWRLLLAAPITVAVGLLATVDVPGAGGRVVTALRSAVTTVVVVVALVVAGTPIWSSTIGARFTSTPTWKVDQSAQALTVRITRLAVGPGPVLLPPAEMTVLPVTTTRMFALVPRVLYAQGLPESPQRRRARFDLYHLVDRRPSRLSATGAREALALLHVSLVCVNHHRRHVVRLVSRAGYGSSRRVGHLVCLRRLSG